MRRSRELSARFCEENDASWARYPPFTCAERDVSATGFAAIALGVVGLLLLSGGAEAKGFHLRDLRNRAAGLGVASGALFAVSAVSYRGASLAVMTEQPVLRAGVTLAAVVMMQSVIMALSLIHI